MLEARIDRRFGRIEQELRDPRAELGHLRAEVKAPGERVARIETHLEIGMPTQPQPDLRSARVADGSCHRPAVR